MQSRNAGNTIEALGRKIHLKNIGELKLYIRKSRRAFARKTNHLRGKIERQDVVRTFSQTPSEAASAAAYLKHLMTFCGEMPEKEVVIVVVVRPTVFRH